MDAGMRVLVVDDHPINRLILTEMFKLLDCAVSAVDDGAQALAVLKVEDFDLICLDRHMPGLSGDEVALRLPPEQFVVVCSTDLTDLPSRFNGILSKPVSLKSALKAIEGVTAWRRRETPPLRIAAAC